MELTVRKETTGRAMVLYLKGDLDITTTGQINSCLEEIDSAIETLVFDFSELELMDSTGIGSILNAIHLSTEKHFKIKFQEVNELTNEILETVGVYQILKAIQGEAV